MNRSRRPALLAASLLLVFATAAACGGKKKGSPGPTTIDVHGRVVVGGTDVGIAGIAVLTSGQSPVTTGSDGSFAFTGVKTPYTLTLLDSTAKSGAVWNGLTIANPVLPTATTATQRSTQATGTVTGLTGGPAHGYATSPHSGYGDLTIDGGTGAINSSFFTWYGPATDTFTIWSIGFNGSFDLVGAGSTSAPLTDGVLANVSIAMAAVTPAPLTLTVAGVPGNASTSPGGATVYLSDTNSAFAAPIAGASVTSAATIVLSVPHVPGAGLTAQVAFSSPAGPDESIAIYGLTGSSASLPLNAALTQSVPVDAATGVGLATPFAWSAEPSAAVYEIRFSPVAVGDPTFVVFTTSTTTKIPDLSLSGLGLPSGKSYTWTVTSFGPHASLDEYAASGLPPTSGTLFQDQTVSRGFTTQ